ncbi:MAG: complex I NDUFA9 subunit family protein [Pseudomonadota bacterium]|nr:complex I NDUFA9 subunit family protein [Pseudomonadota bacterium]
MNHEGARILLLGGSGFIGSVLCEQLQRRGVRVTVPTRHRASARHLWPMPAVRLVAADIHDSAALARLLPGHDAVVNLVGILHGSESDFARTHAELPRQLAAACAQVGVRRVLHVSALGADAAAPSLYQRSKAAGEAALQEAAARGRIDLTVLRPSVVFGAGDSFLNLFARLQRVLPVMPLAGADARMQPVWVRDVADALVRSLGEGTTIGQTIEACGPDVFTLRQLVRLAGQAAGVRGGRGRPVIGLPHALGWLQATVLEHLPGPTLMSRDNLRSLGVDNIASGQLPGLQALGITPTPLSAVVPLYLGTSGPAAALDAMRQRAGR